MFGIGVHYFPNRGTRPGDDGDFGDRYVAVVRTVVGGGDGRQETGPEPAAVAGVFTIDQHCVPDVGAEPAALPLLPPTGVGAVTGNALLFTFEVDTNTRAADGMLLKVAFRRVPKSAKPAVPLEFAVETGKTKFDSEL